MALTYYLNSLDGHMTEQPNEYYRGLQQAFYDAQWDNTAAKTKVLMQDYIGSKHYHPVEVWINKAIGNTTTFMKNGEDFRQLLFRDIDQKVSRGYMFMFEDNVWLADFWNPSQGLAADILVRRCNNCLNIVDPDNGAVFTIPCVVDYDLTSPTPLINSYILTPNSHANVYVQANEDTLRLFKLNKRFLLNGRPFKLYSYQNLLNESLHLPQPPVLYLDLYLDELHARDDVEHNLADNGEFVYTVAINAQAMNLVAGATGKLDVVVTLNGVETTRDIEWASSDVTIVNIDETGAYQVLGTVGQTATVTATLKGNDVVKAEVVFTVVDAADITPVITLNPAFDKIRQHESIETTVQVEYNGQMYIPETIQVSMSQEAKKYLTVQQNGNQNQLVFTCIAISTEPQTVTIQASSENFEAEQQFQINCVSMFG